MECKTQVEITDLQYVTKGGNAEDVCSSVIFGSRIFREFLSNGLFHTQVSGGSSIEKMGMK